MNPRISCRPPPAFVDWFVGYCVGTRAGEEQCTGRMRSLTGVWQTFVALLFENRLCGSGVQCRGSIEEEARKTVGISPIFLVVPPKRNDSTSAIFQIRESLREGSVDDSEKLSKTMKELGWYSYWKRKGET